MSEIDQPEALGLEAMLAVLEAPLAELEARLAAEDEATTAVRRHQLEALATLAWVLPAEAATAAGRERLLSRLQGDETVLVMPPLPAVAAARPAAPAGPDGLLDPPLPRTPPITAEVPVATAEPAAPARSRRPGPPVAAPPPPRRAASWALALAAV
ncbi:MAG TPA: hypothetical protein VGV61_10205, partial [Thermoanaerobaculia bacterium]|nr:hypothetical protein [Thermoanaerobaculia bacterium]